VAKVVVTNPDVHTFHLAHDDIFLRIGRQYL